MNTGQLFKFYINSSIHVGLAVVAFTAISLFHLQLPVNFQLLMFVFLGTITGYNFVKYANLAGFRRRSLSSGLQSIQLFSFICFIGLVWMAFHMKFSVLVVALFLGLLNLLYAIPLIKRRNLRAIGGIKVFLIALIWAGVTVLFPVMDAAAALQSESVFLLFQRFLYVLVLLLPFEIRDMKYDPPELQTLPQKIGIRNTQLLGVGLLILIAAVNFFNNVPSSVLMVDFLIYLLTAVMVWKASGDRHPLYTSFWVEGIPILWGLLLWVTW